MKIIILIIGLIGINFSALAKPRDTQTSLTAGSILCHARLGTNRVAISMLYQGDVAYLQQTRINDFVYDGLCTVSGCDLSIHVPGNPIISTTNGGFVRQNDNQIGLTLFGQGADEVISLICQKK